ncbi:MAG: hypothetical protein NC905_04800 [Candidatus Omnitrophica bacterium]|nr:hypothetical protein [Candidatus Omnitrophota bacterium]MCM8777563.1 hypothetical protein [Candidatus Omnitrophota bacterium]
MVIEKVQEIKQAEKRAEEILHNAELKAVAIKNTISLRLKELKAEKEKDLAEEIKRYKDISGKDTEKKIASLTEKYRRQKDDIMQVSQKKINLVTEQIWEEIKREVFRQ